MGRILLICVFIMFTSCFIACERSTDTPPAGTEEQISGQRDPVDLGGQGGSDEPPSAGESVAADETMQAVDTSEADGEVEPEAPVAADQVGLPAEPSQGDRWTNSLGLEFIYIEAGEFTMGSPDDEEYREEDERQHRVTLTSGYWLSATEVTQAQWNELMGPNYCYYKGDDIPIETVSWFDALVFCQRLSKEEGHPYRLPTEAEWEYAGRAGTSTAFHYGDYLTTSQANFDGRVNFYGYEEEGIFAHRVLPVKSFPPNAWGFYDMHGNVKEWCSDWVGDYPEADVIDPTGPAEGGERVLRGGAWLDYQRNLRSARRGHNRPTMAHYSFGIRVAMDG